MQRKDPATYPKRDLTPEHTKRSTPIDQPLSPDVLQAYKYVDSVLDTSDFEGIYAWHGWAIREAFLAGISHERNQTIIKLPSKRPDRGVMPEPPSKGDGKAYATLRRAANRQAKKLGIGFTEAFDLVAQKHGFIDAKHAIHWLIPMEWWGPCDPPKREGKCERKSGPSV